MTKKPIELRDVEEAKTYLTQGLWLQRVLNPNEETVKGALQWSLALVADGHPLPPTGFVADLGHVALSMDQSARSKHRGEILANLPHSLVSTYEDYVLGKVYSDWNFERAGDALRRYIGKDKVRGIAFVINQMREKCGFQGVSLPPGIIKGLLELKPQEVLTKGWDSISHGGVHPLIIELYEQLISISRRVSDLLGSDDIAELERGTALAEVGQRVAYRQLLHATSRLEALLPNKKLSPLAGRQEVPSRVLDEDTYPVGGYSSIANKGTMESLLHYQLAYMEPKGSKEIDIFNAKYTMDELLYYSRDENQFLRKRRTLVFVLYPDLVKTRYKDERLPWQRCVLWLGLLVAVVRKLTEWLSTDALLFEFIFIDAGKPEILAHEQHLLEIELAPQILNGTVKLTRVESTDWVEEECKKRALKSLCHCLMVTTEDKKLLRMEDTVVSRMLVRKEVPEPNSEKVSPNFDKDEPIEYWGASLEWLLQLWV